MSIALDILDAGGTLDVLQTTIRQQEELGVELISLAKGIVNGQPANIATWLRLGAGQKPPLLTLKQIDSNLELQEQQAKLNAAQQGNKKLISYATVLVEEQEKNIAAYRG